MARTVKDWRWMFRTDAVVGKVLDELRGLHAMITDEQTEKVIRRFSASMAKRADVEPGDVETFIQAMRAELGLPEARE